MHRLTTRMIENGPIIVTNVARKDEFSEVTLKSEWHEVIQELVGRVTDIEQGEVTVIQS